MGTPRCNSCKRKAPTVKLVALTSRGVEEAHLCDPCIDQVTFNMATERRAKKHLNKQAGVIRAELESMRAGGGNRIRKGLLEAALKSYEFSLGPWPCILRKEKIS